MAFRKRNVVLSRPQGDQTASEDSGSTTDSAPPVSAPGVRPSPLDGRLTTSTGVPSLDALLGGHAGFALGTSLLIEESGTTDFGGALLRYYAAEGVVQGHMVHIVGMGEQWGRDLPGLVEGREGSERSKSVGGQKMKIAWRYERLGEFGAKNRGPTPAPDRAFPSRSDVAQTSGEQQTERTFCHTFDLAKRLSVPANAKLNHIPLPGHSPAIASSRAPKVTELQSSLASVLANLTEQLRAQPPGTVHRLIIPSFLSPALYNPSMLQPHYILPFIHSLRSLLQQYSNQLTLLMTLPLSLYPRSTGLVRWIELLFDGVIELTPFPHLMDVAASVPSAATKTEEEPQGMVHLHRLPILSERGAGGASAGGSTTSGGIGDDMAFTMSRRKFVIKPYSLPPVEGDTEAQQGKAEGAAGKPTKVDLDF